MKAAVGSQNPVKIRAAKKAFKKVFGDCKIAAMPIPSGVSNMPMSFREAVKGAKNRAEGAIKLTNADFGVGFEGGFEQTHIGTFLCGFVAVIDKEKHWGFGKGSGILIPEKILKRVRQGKELGEVMDNLLERKNLKQNEGTTGFFTKNLISREKGFENTLIYALARFIRRDLFF